MSLRSAMSLQGFLASAKAALAAPSSERAVPLTLVVGNESADLDSLCSAVVYAYLRTQAPPRTLHIPLANLPRSDLALRTEMAAVLSAADLAPSDLLTLSDLPDLAPSETNWLLVDHNSLTGPLMKYKGRITGVVDHHDDEGAISLDAKPRVIEKCGSCMSLVVEESRLLWEGLKEDDADKVAKLGLAAILIDTINLTAKEKVKPKDNSAVTFLENKIQAQTFNRVDYFDHIHAVKEDISQLGFRDIFRKDYKEWTEDNLKLGISCVVQGIDYLISKADSHAAFLNTFSTWADERNLDVACVMTTLSPNGEFQRELLVWGRTDKGAEVLKNFEQMARGRFQLEAYNGGRLDESGKRSVWRQRNLGASRKQVAPLLRESMRTVS